MTQPPSCILLQKTRNWRCAPCKQEGSVFQVLSHQNLLIFAINAKATVLAGLGCKILSQIIGSSIFLRRDIAVLLDVSLSYFSVLTRDQQFSWRFKQNTLSTINTNTKRILFEGATNITTTTKILQLLSNKLIFSYSL